MIRKVKAASDKGSGGRRTTLALECGHVLVVFLHASLYAIWAALTRDGASLYFNCRDCETRVTT